MAKTCVVKLTNTTVDQANIYGTDSYKLLEADYSVINELNAGLYFNNESADDISEPVIEILSSKITVNNINVEDMTADTYPLIYSSEHSMSYFKSISYDNSYPPYASPEWTPYDAEQPFYGNLMSYNIGEVTPVTPPSSSSSGPPPRP